MQLPHRPVQGSERELQALLGPGTEEPPRERGPLAVLNARHVFVDFFEPIHAEVLQDLRSWCDEEESVSVRLFHGAPGSGKTRLFIEAAQRLRSQGWQAGFLHEAVEPERFEELLASASERPRRWSSSTWPRAFLGWGRCSCPWRTVARQEARAASGWSSSLVRRGDGGSCSSGAASSCGSS